MNWKFCPSKLHVKLIAPLFPNKLQVPALKTAESSEVKQSCNYLVTNKALWRPCKVSLIINLYWFSKASKSKPSHPPLLSQKKDIPNDR